MRLALTISICALVVAVLAMTPEEEACAGPLMKQLANEKDVETKKFVMKAFKLMNAGKKEEVYAAAKKFDPTKRQKFMDEYMIGPCEAFRKEFEQS